LKVNVHYKKRSEFGIFVRYYDENNYYVFKFNVPEEAPIMLVRRSAGVDKIIASHNEELTSGEFNRLYIVFDHTTISLNV